MQFHHHGYVSGDPRVQPASAREPRPSEIPSEVDVLIVGAGPAGMIVAAQLAQFPGAVTRIIDARPGRLEVGRADGIQARTVETFAAFGFAERLVAEAFRIRELSFWQPDATDPSRIVRAKRNIDDPGHLSEFPHIVVNQARVLDYFAESMANAPTRMVPDYGVSFESVRRVDDADHPLEVRLSEGDGGAERTVRARYLVGADGARSAVRRAIGGRFEGDSANHAWGVLDILAVTDFPDVRRWSAIRSADNGTLLLIPREGGFLFRMYVDLGEVPEGGSHAVRGTSVDEIVARANAILHPYTVEVRDVAWHSVYEVAHRLSDRFDDGVAEDGTARDPRIFIVGDACHTHSAKGGLGMNVSMQDGFNLGWKLGHAVEGRSPAGLLSTYAAERRAVAADLIDFDKTWSTMMARKAESPDQAQQLAAFYAAAEEFRTGFMTCYPSSPIVGAPDTQALATGYPIGRRFASSPVARVSDANRIELGHHATADGRWRIYVFAADVDGELARWAEWLADSPMSPLQVARRRGVDPQAWFDVKVVLARPHDDIEWADLPEVFRPRVGPFGLFDYERVYAALPDDDIFVRRGIDRTGAVVVVRPDHYVSAVLPLGDAPAVGAFFAPILAEAAAPPRDGSATVRTSLAEVR